MRRRITSTPSGESRHPQPSPQSQPSDSDKEDALPLTQPPDIMPPPTPRTPFRELIANYFPPSDSSYPPIPPHACNAIKKILSIFYLSYLKPLLMYVIRKTGEGKSLVMMGTAAVLRGVTICLVPLLGLGSSQALKSNIRAHRIEGYHLDEYRAQDFAALSQRMAKYKRSDATSIIVYISPQNLQPGSNWFPVISSAAASRHISFICLDKAHSVVDQSRSFRPEFRAACQSIKAIVEISRTHHPGMDIPILAMSATFRIPEQKQFNSLMGMIPELVIWGDMDRRNVGIHIRVDGEPLTHLIKKCVEDLKADPEMKFLVMNNSAAACDGRIIERLEKACKQLPVDTLDSTIEFVPFTGDCGLMMKMFLMECFCGEQVNSSLPNVIGMPVTAAANCGVSSKKCRQCY
ncbi:hypothetical protein ACHAXN_005444 [Cyclotella atomus]